MSKIKISKIVSRETLAQLEEYCQILQKWNNKINLVSKDDIEIIWERHIYDCVTLAQHIEFNDYDKHTILDFGSGSGLPGMILAICLQNKIIHLVESNSKKALFLRVVAHLANSKIYIHNDRIEKLDKINADIITARAFADLTHTIDYSMDHKIKNTKIYSFKGEKLQQEQAQAQKKYSFNIKEIYKFIDNNRTIIEITNFESKNAV